jgi:hypothetical protein
MRMKLKMLHLLAWLPLLAAADGQFPLWLNYEPNGGAIEITNSGRYFNRPLYGAGNGMLVMAGDRPLIKGAGLGKEQGTLMVALSRGGQCGGWAQLNPTASTTHSYRPGTSSWNMTSPVALGLELHMQAAPTSGGLGMAVRVSVSGTVQPGDELLWLFGGVGGAFDPSTSDPAVNGGNGPHRLIDDRGNLQMLSAGFDPKSAAGNKAALASGGASNFTLTGMGVAVHGRTSSATPPRVISVAADLHGNDPSSDGWKNATTAVDGIPPPPPAPPPKPPAVPNVLLEYGLVLRLRATDLIAGIKPGEKIPAWGKLTQKVVAHQPTLGTIKVGFHTVPAVHFSGANLTSLTMPLELSADQTFIAVVRPTDRAGGCCNALACTYIPTPDATGHPPSTKGVAFVKAGPGIHLILDYDGENDAGVTDVSNTNVLVSTRYNSSSPGDSAARVAGCSEVIVTNLPAETTRSTTAITIGVRASDITHESSRAYDGMLLELVVYNRSLSDAELRGVEAFLASSHGLMQSSFNCKHEAAMAEMVGTKVDLEKEKETFFVFESNPTASRLAETPQQVFEAAMWRTTAMAKRVQVVTPDPHINSGIPMAAAAVDGLWREATQTFVHGAMAWDVPLVGWRSEYGGTIFGQVDRVALEGARMVKSQVKQDDHFRNGTSNINFTVCNADPTRKLTEESQTSRFYGVGRVMPPGSAGSQGMYDMQSQMFTQQIHMWKWTGNTTHETLLKPGLELHAQWAEDCFDDDKNGLYHSYINTWPTDSVYYNGGESVEETAYMLQTYEALHTMALHAGNETAAKVYAAKVEQIKSNFFEEGVGLWMKDLGHPAAWREEVGHQRLRPDPWSYSIFTPIDAGLLTGLEAVQALHYTETGLERIKNSTYPGERHWTSNWVPSIWSTREFWPGLQHVCFLQKTLHSLHA